MPLLSWAWKAGRKIRKYYPKAHLGFLTIGIPREYSAICCFPASAGIPGTKAGRGGEFFMGGDWLRPSGGDLSKDACFSGHNSTATVKVILMGTKSFPKSVAIMKKLVGKIYQLHYPKWNTREEQNHGRLLAIFLKSPRKISRGSGNHQIIGGSWCERFEVAEIYRGGSKVQPLRCPIRNRDELKSLEGFSNYRSST